MSQEKLLEAVQFAIAYNPKGVGDALIENGYKIPSYEANQLYSVVYHAVKDNDDIISVLQSVQLPNPSSIAAGAKPFWETTFGQIVAGIGTTAAGVLSNWLGGLGGNTTPPPPDNTSELILGMQKNMFYMVIAIVVVLIIVVLVKR